MEIAVVRGPGSDQASPMSTDLLMRGMAHDLNNMLAVVASGLTILRKEGDDSRRVAILDGMQRAIFNASTLAKDIVSITGDQALAAEVTSLQSVIDGMGVLVEDALGRDVTFQSVIPSDLWPIRVVRTYFEFALLNLFVNAADAMPDGGTLALRASNIDRRPDSTGRAGAVAFVRIEITDTGVGMPAEVLERVFEPFFTTKGAAKGTGLGLVQVRRFAEQVGGDIAIDSTINTGTRVVIHLPRAIGQAV